MMKFFRQPTQPNINFFIDKLKKNEEIYFCKLNHAFWDALTSYNDWQNVYYCLHGKQCLGDLICVIKNFPKEIMMAVGSKPFCCFNHYYENENNNKEKIVEIFGDNRILFDGGIWKQYVIDKTINSFFDYINDQKIMVVMAGLKHTQYLNVFTCFTHFELDLNSYNNKEIVYENLLKTINPLQGRKIILLQGGDLLSTWLVFKLAKEKICCIDMGRSLDFFIAKEKIVLSAKDQEICQQKAGKNDIFCGSISNQLWY